MGLANATATVGERKQMTLPKKGNRAAILSGIVDVGVHSREYKGEMKPPCREFIPYYTLLNDTYENEETGEVHNLVVRPYPIKLLPGADRSNYKTWYEALDPNHEVLDAKGQGDVFKMIGKPCLVNISHSDPSEDGLVFARVGDPTAFPEGFPIPEDLEYTPIAFDLDSPDVEVFNNLSEWVKDQIRESNNYVGSDAEAILDGEKADQPNEEEDDEDIDSPI